MIEGAAISDCSAWLASLPAGCAMSCVTSPPYWGLRDYEVEGQIGVEATFGEYVDRLADVFDLAMRALRPDGTLWLTIGDSYTSDHAQGTDGVQNSGLHARVPKSSLARKRRGPAGLRPKCLVGIPWRLALAMIDLGWILRAEIIWEKPDVMPASAMDRPTRSHETVFMFSREQRYFYDAAVMREPAIGGGTRNMRTVWRIPAAKYRGPHDAVMPMALARRCVEASSGPGDLVIDPFLGTGTIAAAAQILGRRWAGCDLNPAYASLQADKTRQLEMAGQWRTA